MNVYLISFLQYHTVLIFYKMKSTFFPPLVLWDYNYYWSAVCVWPTLINGMLTKSLCLLPLFHIIVFISSTTSAVWKYATNTPICCNHLSGSFILIFGFRKVRIPFRFICSIWYCFIWIWWLWRRLWRWLWKRYFKM